MNLPEPFKAKQRRSKALVNSRPDFAVLPESEVIPERVVTTRKTPHDLKIARYRDRILQLVSQKVTPAMFEKLDVRSADIVDRLPDNSEIALYSDFVQYLEFSDRHSQDMLPFMDYAIDRYLSYLMAERKSRSTIDRHIASLVKWADYLEIDDPRTSFKVKMRIAEIRKKIGKKVRQAEGLRASHLNLAITLLNPAIPRDCQDITLLFVAWETQCRRSELVGFNWEDLSLQPDGSSLLMLERSKTDQDGEGAPLYVSSYTTNILLGWRSKSNRRDKAGAIFRGIYSDGSLGERLSDKGVERCFKRIAKRLALPPEIFSGHSTRVGSAQEMIERDIDSAKIMLSGRWKTMAMLTRYAKKIHAKRGGTAELTKMLEKERAELKAGVPAN